MNASSTTIRHNTPFSVATDRRPNGVVVALKGSCTMEVADQISDALLGLGAQQAQLVVIDLAQLDFIESTGLGGIVSGYLRLRRHEGDMRLAAPQPSIRKLLDLTRLSQLFTIFPTAEQALAAPVKAC